jgi:hypothetical protein
MKKLTVDYKKNGSYTDEELNLIYVNVFKISNHTEYYKKILKDLNDKEIVLHCYFSDIKNSEEYKNDNLELFEEIEKYEEKQEELRRIRSRENMKKLAREMERKAYASYNKYFNS